MFLLVRLSLFISKESFTDGSKLIDIDGIVPEVVTVESPTNPIITYSSLSKAAKQASIF